MNFKSIAIGAAGAIALAASFAVTSASAADAIPYPNGGTENPITYTFTAATTGDLTAYFDGSGASFDETLGLIVNGVDTGITALDNHSSNVGDAQDFGGVNAGDSLVFYIRVGDFFAGQTFNYYSAPSMNPAGENHIYSTSFSGNALIPAGTYVGFEDESPVHDGFSDFNYQDEQFVFSNTATISSGAPEPAAWALMLMGFGGLGLALRRRTTAIAA